MSLPFRLSFRLWVLAPVLACGFLIWTTWVRWQRVEYVSGIAEWSVDAPAPDAASPTGYAGGVRRLLVSGHNNDSYEWIVQTQQMLAKGDWRVRHVDYDNAPHGRESHVPSLYRWWLGLVAWLDHFLSDRPLALSVERAALLADPLFHLLLVVVTAVFTARWFGGFAAALVALGLVALFPFAAEFLPGAPDHHGLAVAAVGWSMLPLLAGIKASQGAVAGDAGGEKSAKELFLFAGVAGGLGLWINLASQGLILAGIAAGGLLAAWLRPAAGPALPWRSWALGGAVTSLVAYALEYFPGDLALRLEVNHPLYAVAWLGGGEMLWRLSVGFGRGKSAWDKRAIGSVVLAAAALAAAPTAVMMQPGDHGFFLLDPLGSRLTNLNGVAAKDIVDLISREGVTAVIGAVLFPWLLIGVAVGLVIRRRTEAMQCTLVAVALGPVWVALILACLQLRWCNQLDAALLALLVAAVTTIDPAAAMRRWWWAGFAATLVLPGLLQLLPPVRAGAQRALSAADVEGIIERDLAHWLAKQTGGRAVVLAPPDLTTSLFYHGGLPGIGTLDWENQAGLAAAVRITSATSPDEARALIHQRGITHIVFPSWDNTLNDYARLESNLAGNSFMAALHRWVPLVWLRPVPYHLPKIGGFEGQTVTVFQVVDEQEESAALSRQAEYFVEMGQLDLAAGVRGELQRYPADLGAVVALAHVEAARNDAAGFAKVFNPLLGYLTAGADRSLPWDRRVSLVGVLALGNRPDLAREQVRRCLTEADEARLRSLTTGALFRLLALGKKFSLEIADPRLREQARDLLPPGSRSRL